MKKILRLALVILFAASFSAKAQQIIDSLSRLLRTQKEDTNRVNILNDLAWEYLDRDVKKADSLCRVTINLANKLNYIKGRSSAYNSLGLACLDENDPRAALAWFKLSLADKEKLGQQKPKATVLSNMGIASRVLADFPASLNYYEAALKLRIALKDIAGQGDTYNNLGNVYSDMGQMSKANECFEKALGLRMQTGNYLGMAQTYNNLAGICDNRGDYRQELEYFIRAAKILDSLQIYTQLSVVYANIGRVNKTLRNYKAAIEYQQKSIALALKSGSENDLIGPYSSLSDVYLAKGDPVQALQYVQKALALMEKGGDRFYRSHCLNNVAVCYEDMGKYEEARQYYEKGLAYAIEVKNKREELSSLCNLVNFCILHAGRQNIKDMLDRALFLAREESYGNYTKRVLGLYGDYYAEVLKQPAQAIPYYKRCIQLTDSIFSEDVVSSFAAQQVKYETEKKESEIKLLKQEAAIKSLQLKERELSVQKRNYLLVSLGLLMLLVVLLGYIYVRYQRGRQAQQRQAAVRRAEEQERMRMARDIHDDLGSGLSKIRFLSELVASGAGNAETHKVIRSISDTSVALVENMRDLIWALNPDNTMLDSLVARIREYASEYLGDTSVAVGFEIDEQVPALPISKEAHRHIFFIVKEALQNTVKHAAASEVVIRIAITDVVALEITDNGRGGPMAATGNGLKNMRQRAEALGAQLIVQPHAPTGTSVKFSVALQAISN